MENFDFEESEREQERIERNFTERKKKDWKIF